MNINNFFRKVSNLYNTKKVDLIMITKKLPKDIKKLYRFLLTFINLIFNKMVIFYNNHLIFGFFVFFLIFILFYFGLAQPYNKPIPNEFKSFIYSTFEVIGFSHFGDETVRNIISRTTNSLGFILSLLTAIYVFTHREQKSVAPSASIITRKNGFVMIVIVIVLFTMITGYTLVENYDTSKIEKNSLHMTKILSPKILLWLVGLLWSIQNFIELIKFLFDTMSINKMLKSSITATSQNFNTLARMHRHKWFNKLLTEKYRILHYNIESIYQNLKYVADNNMNKEFEENIEKLANVVNNLKSQNNKYDINNFATFLLESDKKHFVDVYNSLLRNTLSLIVHLYKHQHYKKGRRMVSLYFQMYVEGEDRLKQYFALSLKEFLDSIEIDNERQLRAFLDELEKIAEEQTLIIYKNLIMKLIIQNNVKMLTNIVYDFKENISKKQKETKKIRLRIIAQKKHDDLKSSLIVILMQCLVKSIEISHYATTGFLVKYLVTNFNGAELNKGFYILKKNPHLFTKIFEQDDEVNSIIEYHNDFELISINKETFDYCCKKLCILLYGQQLYAEKNKLWLISGLEHIDKIEIENEFFGCTFSAYMIKKVKTASYGLLFFNDTDVMNDIYKILGVESEEIVKS